jgi:uncharacterized protein
MGGSDRRKMQKMRLTLIALGLIFTVAKPGGETLITILTGGTNGVYYPLGTTLSSVYTNAIPGANATAQAYGSVENLRL